MLSVISASDLPHTLYIFHRLLQLESVAECASRLRLLSKALDVRDLRLDGTTGPWKQELVRLQGAGLGLDVKESLLEACGLVLLANNQLDPQKSGELWWRSSEGVCQFVGWHICPTLSNFHIFTCNVQILTISIIS